MTTSYITRAATIMTAIIFQDSELDPGNVGDNNLRKQHKKSYV